MSYRSVFAPNLFAGKVIIVTGGGSGIGRCTAHELAALGATVSLVGRKVEKLQKVADEITEDGGKVSFQVCDIRQEEAVKQTVAAVIAQHGPVYGLVNNAGGQFMTPLEAISAKGWEAVVNTNLTGGFLDGDRMAPVVEMTNMFPACAMRLKYLLEHALGKTIECESIMEVRIRAQKFRTRLPWWHINGNAVVCFPYGYICKYNEPKKPRGHIFQLNPKDYFIIQYGSAYLMSPEQKEVKKRLVNMI